MNNTMLAAFHDELQKIAATRYEQEISAGNITRGDVAPGLPNVQAGISGMMGRKLTRDQLAAPAARSPEELAKTRLMSGHQYNAQAAHPEAMANGVRATVSKEIMPGAVAATRPGFLGEAASVNSPQESGQFLRGMGGGLTQRVGTMAGVLTNKPGFFPDPASVDPTLNKAVLHHELGEAAEMGKPVVRPFASHMGTEPIVRENLALQGDPEAIGHMKSLRKLDAGDQFVQKAIRSVGGTPDAPIPIGGAQHRALDRIMDRSAKELPATARQAGVKVQIGMPEKTVGYMPEHARTAVSDLKGVLTKSVQEKPGLRTAIDTLRKGWQPMRVAQRFISKGV